MTSVPEEYKVVKSTRDEVKEIILTNHYAHRMPMVQYAFSLMHEGTQVGIITYGIPASRSLVVGTAGEEYSSYVIELNRLWTVDNLPKNVLSYFVATTLKELGNKIVVSYADTGMHHSGYIYQATNFIYTGQTKRRTDIYTGEGKHSRHYDSTTNKDIRIVRTPKNRYILPVGDKRFKKRATKALKYPVLPYPKGDNKSYSIGDSKPEIVFNRNDVKK